MSVSLMACGGQSQQNAEQIAKNVNAQEMHDLYAEKGGQILDVRTDGEVAQGYVTGALQIDFYRDDFNAEVEKLNKEKPVYVYCAAGGRSGKAMQKMKSMGFKEVYNLSGGFPTWQSAGFEVSK